MMRWLSLGPSITHRSIYLSLFHDAFNSQSGHYILSLFYNSCVEKTLTFLQAVTCILRKYTYGMLTCIRWDIITTGRCLWKSRRSNRYLIFTWNTNRFETLAQFVVLVLDGLVRRQYRRHTRINLVENRAPFGLCFTCKDLSKLLTKCVPVVELRSFFRFQSKTCELQIFSIYWTVSNISYCTIFVIVIKTWKRAIRNIVRLFVGAGGHPAKY